jgi:DNA-directed RNA polymerase specialized sigma24 family protein
MELDLGEAVRKAAQRFGPDAAQDAAVTILDRKPTFASQAHLEAYVMRRAKGAQVDAKRAASRRDAALKRATTYDFQARPTFETPEARMRVKQMVDTLQTVSPNLREAVIANVLGGVSRRKLVKEGGMWKIALKRAIDSVRIES